MDGQIRIHGSAHLLAKVFDDKKYVHWLFTLSERFHRKIVLNHLGTICQAAVEAISTYESSRKPIKTIDCKLDGSPGRVIEGEG